MPADGRSPGGSLPPDGARGVLDSLLSDLPGVVYRCRNDADRTLIGVTANVEELTGHPPSDLLDSSVRAFGDLIHPDDRPQVRRAVDRAVEHGGTFQVTYRLRTRSDGERWILEQGRPLSAAGEPVLTGYLLDLTGPVQGRISEAMEGADEAKRELGALDVLQSVTAIANREAVLDVALRAVLWELCASLGFRAARSFVVRSDSEELVRSGIVEPGRDDGSGEALQPVLGGGLGDPVEGFPGRVLGGRRVIWIEDVEGEPDFDGGRAGDAPAVRSAVGVPVLSGGRAVAVFVLYGEEVRPRDPVLEDVLRQVGVQLGRVWERELARDAQEREARRVAERDRLHRLTVSSLSEAVLVVGREGRRRTIQAVNEAAERIFGYSRKELIGRTTEFLHVDREAFERFGAVSEKALQERGIFRASFPLRRKDGTVFQAEQTVTLLDRDAGIEGGAVSVVRDVSKRAEARSRLEESEERFRRIAEHVDSIFWLRSPHSREVEYVSPAFERITGSPVESVYQDPGWWRELIHPEDRERVEARLPDGDRPRFTEEYRIVRPDGEIRWIRDRSYPVEDEDGAVVRIVGVAEDVTRRMELEEQLRQAQKMEAVGRLAGGVAHDFNNLLTVIRTQSDLLLMELEDADGLADEVELIRNTADRAAELTRQLLAFSREQVLRPSLVDVNRIVEGMDDLLRRLLGEDVRIDIRASGDLPPVRVDPVQLENVLMNLAVNAREAMPEGGTLRVSTGVEEIGDAEAAELTGMEAGRVVVLEVSDTGTGMDPETLEHIFEPFFTTRDSSGGTGLGLATVFGIVQQSGGHIQVESAPGQGATFTIRLPAARGEVVDADPSFQMGSGADEGVGTVLLVEDDPSVRAVTRKLLLREGFGVHDVEDAESGLELLEAGETAVDLVLTDMVLPGMGGMDLADEVRARFPGKGLVLMSGYAEGSPVSRRDLPADVAFLQKPFTPEGLLRAVRGELARR